MKKIKYIPKNICPARFVDIHLPKSWLDKILPFMLVTNVALGVYIADNSVVVPKQKTDLYADVLIKCVGGGTGLAVTLFFFCIIISLEDKYDHQGKLLQIARILLSKYNLKYSNPEELEGYINYIYRFGCSDRDKETLDGMLASISANDRKYFDNVASGNFREMDVRAVHNIIIGYLACHPQEYNRVMEIYNKNIGCNIMYFDFIRTMKKYGVNVGNEYNGRQR